MGRKGFPLLQCHSEPYHCAQNAAGNIRFLTRVAANRLILRKVGAVAVMCSTLYQIVSTKEQEQWREGSTLEHILVGLRNMTGAPDDLGLSGYVR